MSMIGHSGGPVFQDRSYQTESVNAIWNYFSSGGVGNPVVALPTGTGKSIVIARFLQSVFSAYPMQRIMILTHVKELIQQNYEKLMGAWPFAPAGIYSAGLNQKVHNRPITFAGIASVAKKWALFGHIDLVLIDEAHLVSPAEATMYQQFLRGLKSINPYLKVVGFTATPWRLGHGHITDPVIKTVKGEEVEEPSIFTDVCIDLTGIEPFNRFIAEGFLMPLVSKKMQTELKLDGVHMRGGEFIESELQTAVDREEITYAALREALEYGHNRKKWLIFASGTDHADHIGDMLNSFGVPTGVVHSKREGRDATIKALKRGELRAVVNNNVLTTGFDDPGIDMIVCLRPTASAVLWVQMLGRGTRPLFGPDGKGTGFDLNDMGGRMAAIEAGGKHDCLVLDYARNARRLGPINNPVVPRRKGQKGGPAPVKECPVCVSYVHASLRWCNGTMPFTDLKCTHEFTFETKITTSASSDEVVTGDMPIVEVFKVDYITVAKHEKAGVPPQMRVTYYCGFQRFNEFIGVERQDFVGRRAQRWWSLRTDLPMPNDTDKALEAAPKLKAATHLRVWVNKKYPEILATCFDGTAFGTQDAPPPDELPSIQIDAPRSRLQLNSELDDDIPF